MTDTPYQPTSTLPSMADLENCGLPNMQFEDGDVLIKLSSIPKNWLVLHKDILAAASPVMARSLLGGLAGPHFVSHPVKNKAVKMWTLLLHYESDSDTYWLQSERTSQDVLDERLSGLTVNSPQESKTWDVQHKLDHDHQACICLECESHKKFCSDWQIDYEQAEWEWVDPLLPSPHNHRSHIRHAHKLLCETDRGVYRSEAQYHSYRPLSSPCIHGYEKGYRTVKHLKIFFALLYGYSCPTSWDMEEPQAISNILSYAHFYDCVEHILAQLQLWMCQHPTTFPDIEANWRDDWGSSPITGTATLAREIRCGPVLIDHVRNAIVNARTTNRPRDEIARVLGLSMEELDAMAPSAAESPLATIREDELLQELIKGQLHACMAVTDWDMVDDEDENMYPTQFMISEGLSTLPEAAKIWKDETPLRSFLDVKAAQITTMIYSEWLANCVAGPTSLRKLGPQQSQGRPHVLSEEKHRIPHIAYLITTASKYKRPHLLFGEGTVSEYVLASTTNSDNATTAKLVRVVKIKLDSVVERVAQHLTEWQNDHQVKIQDEDKDLGPVTFRSVEHPGNSCNYLPYAALCEDALPWAEEEPWVRRSLPPVDETPASEAFLRELGFSRPKADVGNEIN